MGLSLNLKFKTKRYRSVNSGYRAAPDEKLWRADGNPETHLVPLFCGAGAAGCGHKTFPVRR